MPWEFTEHHVRPNVFYWSPTAHKERNEVKTRRDQAQAAYKEAKKATSEGRHANAEQLLLHAVAAWPDNDRFSLALADCIFLDRGRPAEALEWYHEIVRLKDCPPYRAARSRCLAALGALEDALEDIIVATEAEPEHPNYLMSRAMLKERLGRFRDAVRDYDTALPLLRAASQPIFECLFNRGYCYMLLSEVEAAIHDLEAAMLQSTASMTVRTVLGVLYLTRRRYTRAMDLFAVVRQHQSASASAANNVALAAYLAVTSDYDDSNATTRAASLNQQRHRAALAATGSIRRRTMTRSPQPGAEGEGGETPGSSASASSSPSPSPTPPARSLASQVAAAKKAAAERPGSALGVKGRSLPPLAALLDERVAADQGPLPGPKAHADAPRPTLHRLAPGNRRAATPTPEPHFHPHPVPDAVTGGPSWGSDNEDDNDDSPDEEEEELYGGPRGENGEPLPTVYLPANPRQWAVDVVRDNAVQTVWEPEQRGLLEMSLRGFDDALSNQRQLAAEAALAAARGVTRRVPRARDELDADTYALRVGEGGDVPGGLLLILQPDNRLPGTAVVHDGEIEDGEVQYNRGLVLLALGRLHEASADLDSAQSANPHHAHYPYYQAVVCARTGKDEEAIAWDKEALRRNPRYFHALYHLGLVLHLRGEHSEAIQRLDAAAALKPRDWRVMEARGRVLQDLDRHTDAVPALRAALAAVRSDGDQPPAVCARLYFALAQSAVAAHLPSLLRESLRLAVMNGQDPASVYNLRGCLARKERQFPAALRFLTRAVQQSPTDPRFYYDRAQCYLDMSRWPEAIDDLTSALEVVPTSSSSAAALSPSLSPSSSPSSSLGPSSRALLLFSRGGAQLAFGAGDVSAAAADLQRAADLCEGALRGEGPLWESRKFMSSGSGAPDLSPSLWYQLGCARARCGATSLAVASFQRAASLMPNHPSFLHELAKACQVSGDAAAAVTHFNRVLTLQPTNARALLRRGLALKCLRRYDEAAADLLAARRLRPADPLMQLDMRTLGNINYLELSTPGEEDDVFEITRF